NNTVELEMQTSSGVSYLYNNFNFRDYMSKYRPQVDIQSDEARRNVSDYIKELSIDYYLSAVIPPDESIEIKLQVYDFSISRWLTVSINNLSFYEKNIGSNIGYIKDYLNSELNMFTRLEINAGRKGSVDIKVNYLDLMFYYYERGIYTIKPYRAIVENYLDITREAYIEAFKLASLDNGDIISKTGYQPMGYLRLTDGYDNSINRNLLNGSSLEDKTYIEPFISNGEPTEVTITDSKETKTGKKVDVKLQGNANRLAVSIGKISLVEGKVYTISFKYKARNINSFDYMYFLNKPTGNYTMSSITKTKPVRNEDTWNTFTYQLNFDGETGYYDFLIGSKIADAVSKISVSDIKIEEGIKGTPWQPNPEDIYGANDPNTRIELQAKDKDNNIIPSKSVSLYENKQGMNLLSNKDIIKNTSKGSYVQGDTKELTMSLWGSRITQTGS